MSIGHIHAEGQRKIKEMADYYRCPQEEIRDRYWIKLDKILDATSEEAAEVMQKKAVDSFFMFCLKMWAEKQIKGPLSAENLEKEAKKAEGLVDMLRDKRGEEAAQKQIKKAEALKKEAKQLRNKG